MAQSIFFSVFSLPNSFQFYEKCAIIKKLGSLAQLARASRLHREGRGFEPLATHQDKNMGACSQIFILGACRRWGDLPLATHQDKK